MLRIFLFLLLVFPGVAFAEPTLVDRVMDILGKSGVGSIEVKPSDKPAEKMGPPLPAEKPSIEIAHNYLPIYADESDSEIKPLLLPFYSSAPLTTTYPDVTNVVIILHDADREAARAFAYVRSAADESSSRHAEWSAATSFIFAPQFLVPEDIAAKSGDFPDAGHSLLRFTGNTWIDGGNGAGAAPEATVFPGSSPRAMSSFEIMDYLLLILSRPQFFPHLQRVVLAGTGAGANFAQRYAVLGLGPDILNDRGIDVRIAVMQPRSFLYLDKTRANPAGLGMGADPANAAFNEPPIGTCAPYNHYPFGFDDLPPYAKKQGENDIRLRYPVRRVFYLVSQNSPDLPVPSTPEACAFTLQGKSALQRAQLYYAGLTRLYGDDLTAHQRLISLPALADDGLSLWRSECSMAVLFGDGACKQGISN